MAINFSRLFTTLGKILGGLNEINTARYTTLTSRIDSIADRFESVFQDQIPDIFTTRDNANAGLSGLTTYYRTLASRTLIKEVQADNVTIPSTVSACLQELRRQMLVSGESLQNATLASAITSEFLSGNIGSTPADYNVGNLLIGTFDQTYLRPDHYFLAPTLGSDNGATEYQEVFTVQGDVFNFSPLDARWPAGENVSNTVLQIDPLVAEWFTAEATGGDWTEVVTPGTASANVRGATTTVYSKGSAGGGDVIVSVEQAAGDLLRPNTWYAAYFLVNQNSTQSLRITAELTVGAGGVSYPAAEVSATQDYTVNTGTDIWQTIGVVFRTKEKLPDLAKLRLTLTAMGGAATVRACYPNMTESKVVELYPLGPAFAMLAGNYPAVAPNLFKVTVGSHTTAPKMVQGMERLFTASSSLVQGFPLSASPTISDSLIA